MRECERRVRRVSGGERSIVVGWGWGFGGLWWFVVVVGVREGRGE